MENDNSCDYCGDPFDIDELNENGYCEDCQYVVNQEHQEHQEYLISIKADYKSAIKL